MLIVQLILLIVQFAPKYSKIQENPRKLESFQGFSRMVKKLYIYNFADIDHISVCF